MSMLKAEIMRFVLQGLGGKCRTSSVKMNQFCFFSQINLNEHNMEEALRKWRKPC